MTDRPALSADERREILARHIAIAVQNGARVEFQSDFQAVVVFGRPVNHLLHLVLSLVTALLWTIVWLIATARGGERRVVISVDADGHVEGLEGPRQ